MNRVSLHPNVPWTSSCLCKVLPSPPTPLLKSFPNSFYLIDSSPGRAGSFQAIAGPNCSVLVRIESLCEGVRVESHSSMRVHKHGFWLGRACYDPMETCLWRIEPSRKIVRRSCAGRCWTPRSDEASQHEGIGRSTQPWLYFGKNNLVSGQKYKVFAFLRLRNLRDQTYRHLYFFYSHR